MDEFLLPRAGDLQYLVIGKTQGEIIHFLSILEVYKIAAIAQREALGRELFLRFLQGTVRAEVPFKSVID